MTSKEPSPLENDSVELTDLVRAGHTEHFGRLFTHHRDHATTVARRYTRDPSQIDELVADAFERVLLALRRGRGPDDQHFAAYLGVAVRTAAIDAIRRHRADGTMRRKLAALPAAEQPWERAARVTSDRLRAAAAIHAYCRLPLRYRLVLERTRITPVSESELCAYFHLKRSAVDALSYRARRQLRRFFAEEWSAINRRSDHDQHRYVDNPVGIRWWTQGQAT